MSKKLSLKQVEKENEIYKETIDVPIKVNGEDYAIVMYPFFSPTRIENVVNEFAKFAENAKEEKLKIKENDEIHIVHCFVIKEFTDIKFTTSKKAKTIYAEFKQLINNPLYKELTNYFLKDSMDLVYEAFQNELAYFKKIEDLMSKTQQEIKNLPIENKEILLKSE